jgi:hypothetical protein
VKSWLLRDGRRRCARCRRDWRPERLPLRLSEEEWPLLLLWFAKGLSSAQIAREARLDRKRVLRALLVVRRAMSALAPPALRPAGDDVRELRPLEVDDTELAPLRSGAPVLGLHVSPAQVWADVIDDSGAARIAHAVTGPPNGGIESPRISPYDAVAYRAQLYRASDTASRSPSFDQFDQIEAFWTYLQSQLRAKGGVRHSRLGLYLAEYAWRYNNRSLEPADQVRELMMLIRQAQLMRGGAIAQDDTGSALDTVQQRPIG